MIFFDATGKRWRKIKLSAAGMTVLAAAPVCLLGIGTLTYQPKWGQLPLISQARNFVNEAAGIATGQVAAAAHPSQSPSPTPSGSAKPSSKPTAGTTSSSATPAPTSAVLSASTSATPQATPSPTTTPTPSTAPGNSGTHRQDSPPPHSH